MSPRINWNEVIKKEARGSNDEDFGEVQDISNGYVFVQKGIINKQKFFIPQEKVESYDGDTLRFGISSQEAISTYQGDSFPTSSQNMNGDQTSNSAAVSDEIIIPVIEERLDVNKRIEKSHVTIIKEPVTETKTIKVSLFHEEVSFETRKPTGDTSTSQEPVTSKEVIEIPFKREEAEVSTSPYVREELIINKKPLTETQEVIEEITTK